jgi:hypothetical protein
VGPTRTDRWNGNGCLRAALRSTGCRRRHPRNGLRHLEQQVPSYAERNDYLDAPAALAPTQRLSVNSWAPHPRRATRRRTAHEQPEPRAWPWERAGVERPSGKGSPSHKRVKLAGPALTVVTSVCAPAGNVNSCGCVAPLGFGLQLTRDPLGGRHALCSDEVDGES